MTASGQRVSFWGDENVLDLVVMVAHCGYTKTYFKRENFVYINYLKNKKPKAELRI